MAKVELTQYPNWGRINLLSPHPGADGNPLGTCSIAGLDGAAPTDQIAEGVRIRLRPKDILEVIPG